ncbi:ABC-type sugar transport system, ATP-binding protein [Leucobacter sp. 7(1)]|uniref:ATP-binding cassette domain-containing protein n=1 Tax=Leucobacter sp. 7(1) TaxID=1255613 RepID=UPI00097ECFFA|nr:ATP-binding cassette domain-containing protein [Leucobacter sp. 7(1)]SJN09675.1 ABC-type sugar transport system, ATP-binding protein [Leucobacter sp. 7(1)]
MIEATRPSYAPAHTTASDAVPSTLLEMRGIERRFPGVHALKNVTLSVTAGEVHALVGENGAGKSTLMAVASGALAPNEGIVLIGGVQLEEASPETARELGLGIVRQDPALLPDLTVAENMAVGVGYERVGGIRRAPEWARTQLEPWGVPIDPTARVADIPVEQRFIVEIAKALALAPKVLILDEPTEHLNADLVERLFGRVRELAASGTAVVYISHRIPEVKRISDRLTVLRDGAIRGTFPADSVSEDEIVELVIGRALEAVFPPKGSVVGSIGNSERLTVEGLESASFTDINLTVKSGEIVGIAGVQGNGQAELIRALAGLSASAGTVSVAGTPVRRGSNVHASRAGIAYVPADRHGEGVFLPLSVGTNIVAQTLGTVSSAGVVSESRSAKVAREQIAKLGIKTPSTRTPVKSLSGGNQQKVVLARALLAGPRVILAEEPTQGVDAGARVEIYQILRDAADQGAAVVILSSDGVELEGLCDRVLIMSRGQIVKELAATDVSEEGIARAALTATTSRIEVIGNGRKGRRPRLTKWLRGDQSPAAVLALVIAVLAIAVGASNPAYFSAFNIANLLFLVAPLILVGSAQLVTVLGGGFDLSVGPLMGFLVVTGSFWIIDGGNIWFGLGLVLIGALGVGFLNGFLTSRFTLSPIVVTLATYMGLQGAFLALRPTPGGLISSALTDIVTFKIGMVPVVFIVAVAVAGFLEWSLRCTRWGIELRGYGSRADAAERLGIPVRRVQLFSYVLSSLLVLPAALIMMAQVGIGDGGPSLAYTLSSVTVLVLAGASIFGGRGSFIGIVVAAVLVQQVINAMPFFGLTQAWSYLLPGLITVGAAIFYAQLRRTRS